MSIDEQIQILKVLTKEESEEILLAYLTLAGNKICRKAYPFLPDKNDVPAKYQGLQVEIAAYLLDKRGANGEIAHSENGISRSYESGDIPYSMLADIVPFAEIV